MRVLVLLEISRQYDEIGLIYFWFVYASVVREQRPIRHHMNYRRMNVPYESERLANAFISIGETKHSKAILLDIHYRLFFRFHFNNVGQHNFQK